MTVLRIPSWLRTVENVDIATAGPDRSVFERTQRVFRRITRSAYTGILFWQRRGFLQRLDPRIRVTGLLLLLGTGLFLDEHASLLVLLGLSLVLAVISSISPVQFAVRAWTVVPLITILIALPAALNLFTDGEPLLVLYRSDHPLAIGPLRIPQIVSVTREGMDTLLYLVMRATASVSYITLIGLSTPWSELLGYLAWLKIPQFVILLLGLTQRFLFLFVKIVFDLIEARLTRTYALETTRAKFSFATSRIGFLACKAIVLSRELNQALESRGFSGRGRPVPDIALTRLDVVWVFIVLSVIVLL